MTADEIDTLTLDEARDLLKRLHGHDDRHAPSPSVAGQASAARSLEAVHSQLRATLDAIADLLFEIDLDGRYHDYYSPKAELLAAPPEAFLGKTVHEVLPGEAAEIVMAALAEAHTLGYSLGKQLRLEVPQGQRWFELSVAKKPVPHGEAPRFVMLSRDITERHHTAEALAESESRFRDLASGSPGLIWMSAIDQGCTYFNQAWLDFTGHPLESQIGDGWAASVHPDDLDMCLTTYGDSLAERAPFRMEYRLRRADGVYRWVLDHGVPRYNEHNELIGYVGTCLDVTENRAAAESLRASEERLSLVLRATDDAVWDIDVNAGTVFVSPRWWEMLGFPGDHDAATAPAVIADRVHPADYPAVGALFERHLHSTAETFDFEVRLKHRLGHYLPVYSRGFIRRDANGKAYRVTGSNRDVTDLRRQSDALRRTSELLLRMGEIAHVGGWEVDVASGAVTVTDEVYRIFERPTDAPLVAGEELAYFAPGDRAVLERTMMTCQQTGAPWDLELPIRTASGTAKWVRVQGSAVVERGTSVRLVGALQDVTERRRAEDAIKRSEARLQSLLLASPIPIALNNEKGDVLFVNPAFFRMFGYTITEIPTVSEWWPRAYPDPHYREQVIAEWGRRMDAAHRTGSRFEPLEVAVTCEDGSVRTTMVNATPIELEGETGLYLVEFYDITEERRSTQALLDFKFAFDQHAIVDISDAGGTITYANDKICALSGYSREEIVGRDHRIFNSKHHSKEFMRTLWATIQRGEVWKGEVQNRAKDGSYFWVDTTIVPFLGPDKRPVQYISIRTDITERQRTQRLMLRAQRMESIGTLAGGVAHDLNNALSPILMVTDLLRIEYPSASELIDLVEASAKRGASMVRQLLTFAKGVDGERISLRPATLIEEVEKIVTATFPKNIHVRSSYTSMLPAVSGDPTQLHQVLLNLCVNARDAMPSGGSLSLSITTGTVRAAELGSIPLSKPGHYVAWHVTDTGAGMPPEVIERLFEPFFSTKGPDRGTGLGLSTVMGIVKSHGGFTRVESTLGVGSTFSVYLPAVAMAEAPAPAEHAVPKPFRGRGQRILIVDDEADVRRSLTTVLTGLHFSVSDANGAEEALEWLERDGAPFDAIITDLHMPGMDGVDLVRRVQQLAPKVKIICASGRLGDSDARELRALGVSALLGKPFTRQVLIDALQTLFGQSR